MLWSGESLCEEANPEIAALARLGTAERVRLSELPPPKPAAAMPSRVSRLCGHTHDSGNPAWRFRSLEATTGRVYLNEVDTPLCVFGARLPSLSFPKTES